MNLKRIITNLLIVLVVGMVTLSGVMKLVNYFGGANTADGLGIGPYKVWLGLAEIVFAGLYAYPKTMKIGFILLASYFGGALATELTHQATPNALIPLVLIWASAWFRDKSIFLSGTGEPL